ncbi:MAG: FxDxF family PEP-CTERM protein [Betaproteobacteria bacterium]|nr:FxDxF family PEP-CTERM protein [Betaproteobacteria bacterium]
MNRKFGVLSVLLFAFTGAAQAAPQVITFDETGSSFFANTYPEVDYFNVFTGQIASSGLVSGFVGFAVSGYRHVADAISTEWIAFNPNAVSLSSFASASGELFNLDSFWLAGAWGSQTLTITGYADGVLIDTATIGVSITAQEYFFSGFQGIDTFTIATGNDFVLDPLVSGSGRNWAMGSVTITAVPEPETYAMLLAGLGIVGAVARRRRIKAM